MPEQTTTLIDAGVHPEDIRADGSFEYSTIFERVPKAGVVAKEREHPIVRPYQLADELERTRAAKDNAYHERDMLVSALSKSYPSHLARHPDSDESWDDDWRTIVCVHGPTGQMTWHIQDAELPLFSHLVTGGEHWEGYTTAQKYDRLNDLSVTWRQ